MTDEDASDFVWDAITPPKPNPGSTEVTNHPPTAFSNHTKVVPNEDMSAAEKAYSERVTKEIHQEARRLLSTVAKRFN